MSAPVEPPRPDRGTGLGRAARGLARALSWIAAIARKAREAGAWFGTHRPLAAAIAAVIALGAFGVFALADPSEAQEVGAGVVVFVLAIAMVAGAGASIVGVVVGLTFVGHRLRDSHGDRMRRLGGAVGRALTTVWTAVVRIARAAGHALAAGARGVARALRPIGMLLGWVTRAVGRAIARVLGAVRFLLDVVVATVAHVVSPVVRAVGWALGATGRLLGQAARLVGRGLARVLTAIFRALGQVLTPVAHVLVRLGRPFAHAGRRIGDAIGRTAAAIRAVCVAAGRVVRRLRRRAAHALGVAVVKARSEQRRDDDAGARAAARARAVDQVALPPPVPFRAVVDQNEYLYRGACEVHAVVTVDADATTTTSEPTASVVLLLDCSGSMGDPWSKLRRAREAAAASIDALRDGTWFAVVRATESAEVLYPPDGELVPATDETRDAARAALRLLWPEGGTAMGAWLRQARRLCDAQPHAIAHAILLTDGRDESESQADLEAAVRECTGHVQCDCRGIGTDWAVEELRTIASRTSGTVDLVADAADLDADFRAMTESAMAKRVGDVRLRVWTPKGASIRFVRQVSPDVVDLTRLRRRVDDRTMEFATGAWGTESREYHVCIEVSSRTVGEEMLAARVTLEVGATSVARSLVRAVWTDDEERATRVTPRVARATGQADLVGHIRAGLTARRTGDDDTATERLGRAVAIAAGTGNEATMRLLRTIVEVDDEATGTVRLRHDLDLADEMALDVRSTRTGRLAVSAITEP